MFQSGWVTLRALEDEARRRRQTHVASVRARLALQQRVAQLEEDLSWTRLVASTLMSVCIEKALVTEDELRARLEALERAETDPPPAAEPPPAPKVRRRRFRRRS